MAEDTTKSTMVGSMLERIASSLGNIASTTNLTTTNSSTASSDGPIAMNVMNKKKENPISDAGSHQILTVSEEDDTNDQNSISANTRSSSTDHNSSMLRRLAAGDEGGRTSTYSIVSNRLKLKVVASKYLFLLSMLVAGTIAASVTYVILEKQNQNSQDKAYQTVANTIGDSLSFQIYNIFESNRYLGRTITADAFTNDETFPLVYVKGFESYASTARKKGRLSEMMYAPVVYNVSSWLSFSGRHSDWYSESIDIYNRLYPTPLNATFEVNDTANEANAGQALFELDPITDTWRVETDANVAYPSFHTSPPPQSNSIAFQNIDLKSVPAFKSISIAAVALNDAVFSPFGTSLSVADGNDVNDKLTEGGKPQSIAAQPVFGKLSPSSKDIVAFVFSIVQWENFFKNLLPSHVRGIYLVFGNNCNQSVSYEINGNETTYIALGDKGENSKFSSFKREVTFDDNYLQPTIVSEVGGHCRIVVNLYPTQTFFDDTSSNVPVIFTTIIALFFFIMAMVFLMYDNFVENRNKKLSGMATRTTALVETLFPKNVAHRLLEDAEKVDEANNGGTTASGHFMPRKTLRGYFNGEKYVEQDLEHDGEVYKTQPIADLFPMCTVLYSDLAGFTAWSSVREPPQVFILLETIYGAYDRIARRRGVFKVETIGDCYVAVCGVPVYRADHAVAMARFAFDCMAQVGKLTKNLESTLGPDTGDLTMRMGLHSGPVTGGVLRGEKARFQLFGETMNLAACIESSGQKNRIHISQETADLIIEAGKSHWLKAREDLVPTKAKGMVQTFWLGIDKKNASSIGFIDDSAISQEFGSDEVETNELDSKTLRLITWNKEVLMRLLVQIVQRRLQRGKGKTNRVQSYTSEETFFFDENKMIIDEVQEIIQLPQIDPKLDSNVSMKVEIAPKAKEQLEMLVTEIARLYRRNPFHNFEHASHVTQSVSKLLSRIVAPSEADFAQMGTSEDNYSLHDHTYGITSDPLTQFACVLSALIHDLDHPGVPNAQLIKEQSPLAIHYKNKSVAEQNSVEIAWTILSSDKYSELRKTIYSDDAERSRFRQLVVNSVMATDIVDKDLKELRNARWDRAFKTTNFTNSTREGPQAMINRKATIVIEHLIQASDVAHTMQHWHVYRKWNEMFFEECYQAFINGRAESDPSLNWYKGEIGFFDFYIIPLAKKLKDCGVFGVSSDEYLGYAMKNRAEWEVRGEEIVGEMLERVHTKFGDPSNRLSI